MEQTPLSSGHSPELPSVSPPVGEVESGSLGPEANVGTSLERGEQRSPLMSVDNQAQAAATLVAPVVNAPIPTDDEIAQAPITLPTIANDDDLIEKEWVEKAKKVLAETREDPYRREQEVSRLQADYLMKRYGRELGSSQ